MIRTNEEILEDFEAALRQMQTPAEPELLYVPIIYSMSGGGKRLRPVLLLIANEAFGGNTTLPWGMTGNLIAAGQHGEGFDPTGLVHPTFLYESLWCLAGFILLHILSKKCYKFKGQIFCCYAIWYGTGRFLIESLRTDSLMVGPFRVSQLVALGAIAAGAILYALLWRFTPHLNQAVTAEEEPTEDVAEASAEEPTDVET